MLKIRIPATTANLGSAFDAIGLALNKYNEFYFEKIDSGFEVTGILPEHEGEDNMIYKSYIYALNSMEESEKTYNGGIRVRVSSEIPISRGMGSSATCILAGVTAAFIVQNNSIKNIDKERILRISTEIEGHPDNVSAALYGGIVVSASFDNKIITQKIKTPIKLEFVAFIPDFTLSTEKSREVLPKSVGFKDAVFNISGVSLLISSLYNGEKEILKYACDDRLHQPYRAKLIKFYDEIKKLSRSSGSYASFISGAGPTILSIVENAEKFIKDLTGKLPENWISEALYLEENGLSVSGNI